ncbi:hypothetical protein H0H93_003579 [Arthromyces matolae]|nr:hypothetical protein H0H93_003579 [Arthromyces matolae]
MMRAIRHVDDALFCPCSPQAHKLSLYLSSTYQKTYIWRPLNEYKSCLIILAPVFKLPPEILSEIFSAAHNGCPNRLTGRQTPLPSTISFVCQRWRNVIVNLSRPWSTISFDSIENRSMNLSSTLKLYLLRSRETPLNIHATLLRQSDTSTFQALLEHSNHWRNIHLYFDHNFIPLLNTVIHNVPILSQLTIAIPSIINAPRWLDHDITAFISAPELHDVSACDVALRHGLFPLNQIDTLTVTDADIRFTLLLLTKSHENLVHLSLKGWNVPEVFDMDICLPQLKSLCIVQERKSVGCPLGYIFDALQVPVLEILHVEGSYLAEQGLVWSASAFNRMSHRDGAGSLQLRTLSLINILITEEELVLALASLPLLETLNVMEGPFSRLAMTDTLLEQMTFPSPLVPRLRSLSIMGSLRFSPRCLATLLTSRTRIVCPSDTNMLLSLKLTLLTDLDAVSALTISRLLMLDTELPLGTTLDVAKRSQMANDA